MIKTTLKSTLFNEVETARNRVEILDPVSRNSFDLVVTDILMPGGMGGIGVLEAAKAKSRYYNGRITPSIFCMYDPDGKWLFQFLIPQGVLKLTQVVLPRNPSHPQRIMHACMPTPGRGLICCRKLDGSSWHWGRLPERSCRHVGDQLGLYRHEPGYRRTMKACVVSMPKERR